MNIITGSVSIVLFDESSAMQRIELQRLFHEYADAQNNVGIALNFQEFASEVQSLPGKYGMDKNGFVLLAIVNGEWVGCVALRELTLKSGLENSNECNVTKVGEIKRLYVNEAARGNSVGKLLMLELLSQAKKRCFTHLFLDTCARYFIFLSGFLI